MSSQALQSEKVINKRILKPSQIEWLGEVPASWNLIRLRYQAKVNPTKSEIGIFSPDTEVSFVPMDSIGEYGGLDTEQIKYLEDVAQGYTYFRDGDVVVAKITPCFENGKGAIAKNLKNSIGFGTTELHVMRAIENLDSRYLFYLSISDPFRKIGSSEMYGAGGQKRVPESFIKDLKLFIPDKNEQHSIANFLDEKTSRIDALIEKKNRLIILLKEKRTALISHAVTKGLDPIARMKESGVEWLGQVPEDWKTRRLKHVICEPLKYGANEAAELDDPTLPRYIRITDVDEQGKLREETFKSIPEEIATPYLLKEGDLLFARSGATVGKNFYYEPSWGRAAYAGYLIRARCNPQETLPRFLNYFAGSHNYWQWLSSVIIQATIQNVSAEKYGNLIVPLPSFNGQQKIVDYLDKEIIKIDALIRKIQSAIDKLKEYRTALVSAAVTGKIDVRYYVSKGASCQ